MHITFGGIIFLVLMVSIIPAIIVIRKMIAGERVNLPNMTIKSRQKETNTILCWNVYDDCIRVEEMLKNSVCEDADAWQYASKKYAFQYFKGSHYYAGKLPAVPNYPPEKLARMHGAPDVRKLLSLRFDWWHNLAPFAPVAALGIGALLFIMILG